MVPEVVPLMAPEWDILIAAAKSGSSMSAKDLISFAAFWVLFAAPAIAQLPGRVEKCLPYPTLAQEVEMYPEQPEVKVNMLVIGVEFDAPSGISSVAQEEISGKVQSLTFGGNTDAVDATIEPEFEIDESRRVVNVTLKVDAQARYRIRSIELPGPDIATREKLMQFLPKIGELRSNANRGILQIEPGDFAPRCV
jgi:hypothetical protein